MLVLIGREIRDHIVYVLASCVVTAVMVGVTIQAFLHGIDQADFIPLAILMFLAVLILCVLGAAQMYGDRANKVSAWLGTMAVTRNRILAARILVGVLTVLITVAPLAVAMAALLRLFVPGAEFWYPMLAEVSVTVALTAFACYCVGLLIGGTTNRVWLLAGNVPLLAAVVSLVHIKGFGPEVMAILLLFIGAALLRIRHHFTCAAL